MGSKIRESCRGKLMRQKTINIHRSNDQVDSDGEPETGVHIDDRDIQSSSDQYETEPEVYVDTPVAIASLNKCLSEIGVTPYSKTKACQPRYPDHKMKEITEAMKQTIISVETDEDESEIVK